MQRNDMKIIDFLEDYILQIELLTKSLCVPRENRIK